MAPVFEYEAKSKDGKTISGELTADESYFAVKQLREKGYFVTSINKKFEKKDIKEFFRFSRKIKIKDLAVFSQQFSVMINAGITVVDALEIMQEQADHPGLKEVVINVREDIETGKGLSEAMSKHPEAFPELYCQMIKAGETGGILDKVLIGLAEHYERHDEINGKIKSALYYPVTIIIVAIVVIIFLVTQVVPQFVSMFASFGGSIPLPTRILLSASNFFKQYWWLILIIITGLITLFITYRKSRKGRIQFDKLILKVPVTGKMMKKIYLSRFASTLAILLDSGVDLLAALKIVEDVIGNQVFVGILADVSSQIREGVCLSRSLSETEVFPGMLVQMISVGEEAGTMERMLKKVSEFYEREVENSIESSISLIEPVMIVLLAVVVGFIVISIVMPMFDMFKYF